MVTPKYFAAGKLSSSTLSRCITVSDSICAAQILSVQPRLYLCLSLTLSVKIFENNTGMARNSGKRVSER